MGVNKSIARVPFVIKGCAGNGVSWTIAISYKLVKKVLGWFDGDCIYGSALFIMLKVCSP